jgi:hypothetical protein
LARDNQRQRVYEWEKKVFEKEWKDTSLTNEATVKLYNRILTDVGRNPKNVSIRFTKRTGGACASRNMANFTPGRCMPILVLHEAAHTLTRFNPDLRVDDAQGHGPQYVACYLALIERYLGVDIKRALSRRRYTVKKTVYRKAKLTRVNDVDSNGKQVVRHFAEPGRVETVERKKRPPEIDLEALEIWRKRLKGEFV